MLESAILPVSDVISKDRFRAVTDGLIIGNWIDLGKHASPQKPCDKLPCQEH